MKRIVLPSLLAVLLCVFVPAPPALAICVEVGKEAPDISIPDMDGKKVALKEFRGKIVLLAFWASWCPRCEEELIYLQGVYKTSPDIVVLAVNQESQNISRAHLERIRKTLKDWRIDFPVLVDKNLDAWNGFCLNALPTSIIIDKAGIVRYAEANYYWATQDQISDVIQAIRLGRTNGNGASRKGGEGAPAAPSTLEAK